MKIFKKFGLLFLASIILFTEQPKLHALDSIKGAASTVWGSPIGKAIIVALGATGLVGLVALVGRKAALSRDPSAPNVTAAQEALKSAQANSNQLKSEYNDAFSNLQSLKNQPNADSRAINLAQLKVNNSRGLSLEADLNVTKAVAEVLNQRITNLSQSSNPDDVKMAQKLKGQAFAVEQGSIAKQTANLQKYVDKANAAIKIVQAKGGFPEGATVEPIDLASLKTAPENSVSTTAPVQESSQTLTFNERPSFSGVTETPRLSSISLSESSFAGFEEPVPLETASETASLKPVPLSPSTSEFTDLTADMPIMQLNQDGI